ncbi:MAG TPA: hypothetical protein PK264_05550 [Hyphomicrobiaceae bacterium]|nr:hypothetical protein [Hyphomicrobiaceae bacterium]
MRNPIEFGRRSTPRARTLAMAGAAVGVAGGAFMAFGDSLERYSGVDLAVPSCAEPAAVSDLRRIMDDYYAKKPERVKVRAIEAPKLTRHSSTEAHCEGRVRLTDGKEYALRYRLYKAERQLRIQFSVSDS